MQKAKTSVLPVSTEMMKTQCAAMYELLLPAFAVPKLTLDEVINCDNEYCFCLESHCGPIPAVVN